MIVVDASVLAPALAIDDVAGARARSSLASSASLHAPDLALLEVTAFLKRRLRARRSTEASARRSLLLLRAMPLTTHPHDPLLEHAWDLRNECSIYDGSYVALAMTLDVPLVTADRRLAKVARRHCTVRLVETSE